MTTILRDVVRKNQAICALFRQSKKKARIRVAIQAFTCVVVVTIIPLVRALAST